MAMPVRVSPYPEDAPAGVPSDADTVLADWGTALAVVSRYTGRLSDTGQLGTVQRERVEVSDGGVHRIVTREVLRTKRGAVTLTDGQRLRLGGNPATGAAAVDYVCRGAAEGSGGLFDAWVVVRAGVSGGAPAPGGGA